MADRRLSTAAAAAAVDFVSNASVFFNGQLLSGLYTLMKHPFRSLGISHTASTLQLLTQGWGSTYMLMWTLGAEGRGTC